MKKELDKLVDDMFEAYHNEVEEDEFQVCEQAGSEMQLESISFSKLLKIKKYLEERYNISYWLADKFRFNPKRKYMLWISKTRGNDPVWGISPVTA